MRKLKHKDEYKQFEFTNWLSVKLGQKVGTKLGSGQTGSVFEFGRNGEKAIKLSSKLEDDTHSIVNKNIKGVAKIYAHGNISVPERFINKGFGGVGGWVEIPRGQIGLRNEKEMSYVIMEKVIIDEELNHIITDLSFIILRFLRDSGDDKHHQPLKLLFKRCENMSFLKKLYKYILEKGNEGFYDIQNFDKITETLAELCVLFKNIKKDFDWVDIHANQFGYNKKGELVAFDLDNSHHTTPDETKNFVRENKHIKKFGE